MSSTSLLSRIPILLRHSSSGARRQVTSLAAPTLHPSLDRWHWQQVRYKRRDGNTDRERKPSKKQLKKYNRKIQTIQAKQDKHSAPGSKAGPRREFAQALKQSYLESGDDADQDLLDYDFNDALLDDLMGNTKDLSSQPTPEPVYLGDKHRKYFNHVADQMARYRRTMEQLKEGMSEEEAALIEATELPSDKDLSLVVRSYRDRRGTRRDPVGIVKALRHILQDLQVPISIFGEHTYTSLLSSCRTPAEGRRIFKMMKENKHPISSYSWSILVDLYAKVADFEGCASTMDEMVEVGGVAPTLPAFTSLLSACYKVCNDGRIPHSIRARAGEMAWNKWQEMRVVGINPDVMAYGAILRVCAARGHAERAINLLEEMQQMEVKPTTLCFSSALRAVARSHAIAVRFERGSSERHRRREFLTQHHGNMARSLVVMAENAEVEQDDGFVAALILCAASAGDMATAKAIYVASEIRRLDQLRTIGSDEHLARLRGDESPQLISEEQQQLLSSTGTLSSNTSIDLPDEENMPLVKLKGEGEMRSFETREYGNDTRTLSGILHACALAVDKRGMGLMWQGRENKGYLCDNSLRLLTARRVPQYISNSIPGEGTTDNLTWEGEYADVDRKHKLGKRSKFKGVWEDENSAATLDELDESYLKMFVDKDGKLRPEFQKMTPDDVWKLKYGSEEDGDDLLRLSGGEQGTFEYDEKNVKTTGNLYFDTDLMRCVTASVAPTAPTVSKSKHEKYDDVILAVKDELRDAPDDYAGTSKEELFFDDTEMRWKTRTKVKTPDVLGKTRPECGILSLDDIDQVSCTSELHNSLPGHLHVTTKHVNDDYSCCFPGSTPGYIETANFQSALLNLYAVFGCFLDNI
ncbi:hypothetical protein FisN_8Hh262 [Fistulifera solaris]|uniref:Pentacotripeptide-repeat region of PRORP domain-containing protein n=1 Tax=Fistulifera solaris TaxID=1519565 RepID=A0A1Z5JYQ0_FISSO|nr:hypothetical protein FisN_8Hh262 [Fistulifera solaris]|eukprot:GAX19039.1 hypothetical protein FisN_8Hh262 [Fistulifera solaris]